MLTLTKTLFHKRRRHCCKQRSIIQTKFYVLSHRKWVLGCNDEEGRGQGACFAVSLPFEITDEASDEQEAVDQLKFGMTKTQVRYVMGSPMLIENGYPDTWYYIYHHQKGHEDPIQKNLVVNFDATGTLVSINGDFEASDEFFESLR